VSSGDGKEVADCNAHLLYEQMLHTLPAPMRIVSGLPRL
jgi:hypothetical protein